MKKLSKKGWVFLAGPALVAFCVVMTFFASIAVEVGMSIKNGTYGKQAPSPVVNTQVSSASTATLAAGIGGNLAAGNSNG